MDIFPGPHSEKRTKEKKKTQTGDKKGTEDRPPIQSDNDDKTNTINQIPQLPILPPNAIEELKSPSVLQSPVLTGIRPSYSNVNPPSEAPTPSETTETSETNLVTPTQTVTDTTTITAASDPEKINATVASNSSDTEIPEESLTSPLTTKDDIILTTETTNESQRISNSSTVRKGRAQNISLEVECLFRYKRQIEHHEHGKGTVLVPNLN